jgi:hypothetical protein
MYCGMGVFGLSCFSWTHFLVAGVVATALPRDRGTVFFSDSDLLNDPSPPLFAIPSPAARPGTGARSRPPTHPRAFGACRSPAPRRGRAGGAVRCAGSRAAGREHSPTHSHTHSHCHPRPSVEANSRSRSRTPACPQRQPYASRAGPGRPDTYSLSSSASAQLAHRRGII